jgi:hypothetical protein
METINTKKPRSGMERDVCKTESLQRIASKAGWAYRLDIDIQRVAHARLCFHSIAKLKDVKRNRRQIASAKNPTCGYAMNWIEANMHHFEKEVYFPPAVEVEVTDVKYAGIVEQCFNRNTMFVSDFLGLVAWRPPTLLSTLQSLRFA